MPSTLVNLAAEVTYTLGNRADLATLAKTWVNRAYQRIQDRVEFPEAQVATTFNTAASTASYALPADFFSIYSLRNNTTNKRINQISIPSYARLSTLTTGTPSLYALRGHTTVLVWPIPTAIEQLQIEYRKRLATIAADGDLHVLPDAWEEAIIFGATAYGFEYLNEIERASKARSSMRATIAELSDRLAADLVDRDEPAAPVGIQTGVL